MAHELSVRESGFVEMAFTGNRSAVWHGLGNELVEGAPMEDWIRAAGMDWEALQTPVLYKDFAGNLVTNPDQNQIFRSDNNAPLGIVGGRYKVIQPREVLEFFEDLVDFDGMQLTTAGVLFGGKRFWAMADTGRSFTVGDNDKIDGKILLTTSVDGTLATQAMFTSVRVVCNNTLRFAVDGEVKGRVRVTHRSVFNPTEIKTRMGIFDESWVKFRDGIGVLSEAPVADEAARKFIATLFMDPARDPDDQPRTLPGTVENVHQLFLNGAGNNGKTYWDLVNGVTQYIDHGGIGRLPDNQMVDMFQGRTAQIKDRALELALAEVA